MAKVFFEWKNSNGFTLIEVMIVVALLGILAALASLSYVVYFDRVRNSDAMAEAQRARLAQEAWLADNGAYGANVGAIGFTVSDPQITVLFSVNGINLNVCAKHLQGDQTAGCDSNTAACYQINSVKGVALAACPAATAGNDFGGWTQL